MKKFIFNHQENSYSFLDFNKNTAYNAKRTLLSTFRGVQYLKRNTKPLMPVYQQEMFIIKKKKKLLRKTNNTPFGLHIYLVGKPLQNCNRVFEQIPIFILRTPHVVLGSLFPFSI